MKRKTICLVAHDNKKKDLLEWVSYNAKKLLQHNLICTGTTGKLIEELLTSNYPDEALTVRKLKSGPLGGDQQIGALIAEGKIDILIFLWDPMMPQPHEVDVKALLRLSVLYDIPNACTRSTADFIITSPLFHKEAPPKVNSFDNYINRRLNL